MVAHSAVAAVSDRRRRSEIDATIYVALYSKRGPAVQGPRLFIRSCAIRFKSARTHQNRRADLFCASAALPPITTKSGGFLATPGGGLSAPPRRGPILPRGAKLWTACSSLPLSLPQACLRQFPPASCLAGISTPASISIRIPSPQARVPASELAGAKAAASCTHSKASLRMP